MARTRQTWARATATIDGTEYRKVRFVADASTGEARAFDGNGNLLAAAAGATVVLDRRTATVETVDGSTWSIAKARDCGCGG